MGDNSNCIDLLNEFKCLKDPKPFSCKSNASKTFPMRSSESPLYYELNE